MDDGAWVVLGTVVGAAGSLCTTLLAAHLGRLSPYPKYDRAVEKLLRQMLEAEPKWRKIETLAAVTGMTEQDVKEYLIPMGARGSETNPKLWGLISRNPLSEIDKAK